MRRKIVIQEVGIPSRAARRAPSLPQVARPTSKSACVSRAVMRAHGSMKGPNRSVKIFRAHVDASQKNLRAVSRRRTWRPPQGTSATVRW